MHREEVISIFRFADDIDVKIGSEIGLKNIFKIDRRE